MEFGIKKMRLADNEKQENGTWRKEENYQTKKNENAWRKGNL